jgi:tetratricopeptide (TPR) repeat protein
LFNKAWALIDLGKPREALKYSEKAIKVNPRNEYAWYNKAWSHYLMGNVRRQLNVVTRHWKSAREIE